MSSTTNMFSAMLRPFLLLLFLSVPAAADEEGSIWDGLEGGEKGKKECIRKDLLLAIFWAVVFIIFIHLIFTSVVNRS